VRIAFISPCPSILTTTCNRLASEFGLHPIFKEEFHQVYAENHERPEFKDLLIKMKVIDSQGVSAMDEDQWEAASKFEGFFSALWMR
jgi:mRNA (guanine-N7-)-methyltransferase